MGFTIPDLTQQHQCAASPVVAFELFGVAPANRLGADLGRLGVGDEAVERAPAEARRDAGGEQVTVELVVFLFGIRSVPHAYIALEVQRFPAATRTLGSPPPAIKLLNLLRFVLAMPRHFAFSNAGGALAWCWPEFR
ncbi:hypothetical protein D3C78_1589800 [compost metagenome]